MTPHRGSLQEEADLEGTMFPPTGAMLVEEGYLNHVASPKSGTSERPVQVPEAIFCEVVRDYFAGAQDSRAQHGGYTGGAGWWF